MNDQAPTLNDLPTFPFGARVRVTAQVTVTTGRTLVTRLLRAADVLIVQSHPAGSPTLTARREGDSAPLCLIVPAHLVRAIPKKEYSREAEDTGRAEGGTDDRHPQRRGSRVGR